MKEKTRIKLAALEERVALLEEKLLSALICAQCGGTGEQEYYRRTYNSYHRCPACKGKGH